MVKKFKKTEKGWEEIADKEEKEHEDESELEEELEELGGHDAGDLLDSAQLQQFLSPGRSTPVLNKIAEAPQQVIRLERGVADAPTTGTENNGDDSSYLPKQIEEERKYAGSEAQTMASPERVDRLQIGRQGEWERFKDQSGFSMRSESWRGDVNSSNIEKYTTPEKFDVESAGRRDPFKREEKKYDLKPPKHNQ